MTGPITAIAMQQRVTLAIAKASARTGVGFDYLMDQAQLESGMRPDARAQTSSATGLYQFTNQTWLATLKRHGPTHGLDWASGAITQNRNGAFTVTDPDMHAQIMGLRTHPETAAIMAAELASDNGDYLQSRMGGIPQDVDLYLAHFLGAKGAGDFLTASRLTPIRLRHRCFLPPQRRTGRYSIVQMGFNLVSSKSATAFLQRWPLPHRKGKCHRV
jgi:hypothetical protein